ncbi:MAG: beta strand repeat-containing protein, partial [Polymorphobacter sp.]
MTERSGAGDVTNTGGAATLTFAPIVANTYVLSGSIAETLGVISIVMNGDANASQELRFNSNYTGGTTITSGRLGFGSSGSFGSGVVTLNGGTMEAHQNGLTLGNAINVTANSSVISLNTTLSGTITGSGIITKTSTSYMDVTGDNSAFTGGFTVSGGDMGAGANNAFGGALATFTSTAAARITLAAGVTDAVLSNQFSINGGVFTVAVSGSTNTMTLNGAISGAANLWFRNSSGTLTLNADNSGYSGSTIVDAGTLGVGNSAALGTGTVQFKGSATLLTAAPGLTLGNAMFVGGTIGGVGGKVLTVDTAGNDLTINGRITNAASGGALLKTGAGTLTLGNATNNYALGTSINGGTLSVAANGMLGAVSGNLSLDGGVLQVTGAGFTSTARAITLGAGGGGFDILNGFNLTQVVTGSGGLTKLGAGTLQLSAANNFTGSSTISDGTLALANSAGFGSGNVTLGAGVLQATIGGLDMANDLTLAGGGTIDTNGNIFTLSGDIDGVADLVKFGGGTLVLAGANNTYGGGGAGTYINDGAIDVRADTSFGNGNVNMAPGTTIIAGANNLSIANFILLNTPSTIDTGTNTLTLTGRLRDNGGAGALDKAGAGTLILTNGTSDYSGGTNLNAGTINIDNQSALGAGALVMAGGTSFGGASASNFDIANDITINGTSTVGANATRFQLDGNIDGSGQLAMTFAGYLVLRGNNSYTGGTDITAGYVDVGNGNALGGITGGALTLGNGARLGGYSGGVVLPNDIILSGATAGIYASNLTLLGDISGGGTLNVLADATYLQLSGTNTHAGTSIGGG